MHATSTLVILECLFGVVFFCLQKHKLLLLVIEFIWHFSYLSTGIGMLDVYISFYWTASQFCIFWSLFRSTKGAFTCKFVQKFLISFPILKGKNIGMVRANNAISKYLKCYFLRTLFHHNYSDSVLFWMIQLNISWKVLKGIKE